MTDVLVNIEQVPKVHGIDNGTDNQLPIHILIVVGQTFSEHEKKAILDRINSSLVNIGDSLLALKEDLTIAVQSQLFDSVKFDQENCIFYNNETSLQLEILINSTSKTLRKVFRDFIHSNCKNKHFINATLDLNSNGDFNLQDSLFGYDNLNALLNEEDIKKLLLNTENSIKLHLNSKLLELNKNWKSLEKQHKNIHLVNSQRTITNSLDYSEFLSGLNKLLNEKPIDTLMETGKLTGTLRITKPLLYIFPSREGDSAYFTLNGYSILINGGYDRVKPCFWSFVNMLAQIDSILITHADSDALGGLGSFFAKKLVDPETKPNVLTVLGNLIASSGYKSSSETERAQLAANLIATESSTTESSSSYVDMIIDSIERLKIQLMPLTKSSDQAVAKHNGILNNFSKYEHVNLYYKLGQGSLDLYVLSPFANSTDYKEFVNQQRDHLTKHQTHQKSQLNPGKLFKNIPMSHVNSAVVLLVWMPHVTKQTVLDGENNALRLLFTGNAPQHVILNALEKVKDFEILTSPVYKIKPASEPVHNQPPKKTATSSASTANGTKATNISKTTSSKLAAATTTAAKSNLSSKPPVSKLDKSKVESNGASKPTKVESNSASKSTKVEANGSSKTTKVEANGSSKTTKVESNGISKPKSAPVTSKPAPKPVEKKTTEKKTTATSTTAKKLESSAPSSRQSIGKSTTAPSTTATKPASSRLSSQGVKAPVPAAKKSTNPPKKSASKPTEEANMTEEEKRASRIITKRDPKPSANKPAVSKTTEPEAKQQKSESKPVVQASTDSVVMSVDNTASSNDTVASSTESKVEVTASIEDPVKVEAVETVNSATNQTADQSASEWPNLSPVKRDQTDQNSNSMDAHYMEDRNNSIDTNNESGIDADTECQERKQMNLLISDAKDLIQTPEQENNPILNLVNGDVMTRSFIADGSVNSNPFAASTLAENKRQQDVEESINDLNKTHELSDYEIDKTEENQDLDALTKDSEVVENEEPVESAPEQVESVPEPVESVPEQVESAPEPVESAPEPVESSPEPVESAPEPVESASEPSKFLTKELESVSNPFELPSKSDPFVSDLVESGLNVESSENTKSNSNLLDGIDSFNSVPQENSFTNGHHMNGMNGNHNEYSDLEDGEIVDTEPEDKVVLKTGQEPLLSAAVSQPEDPAKWNLLELPKPINPNDLPAPGDKKQATPNGKKPVSPSQEKTKLVAKTASKSNVNPVYVEVSYIPAHGNSHYVDTDFFCKVRARHYVLSTEEPSEKLLNSIIEAKETWEDKSLQITVIPTYESDVLTRWYSENEETLARLKINITPAASMSTLTMDDNPELTCQLYKLEF